MSLFLDNGFCFALKDNKVTKLKVNCNLQLTELKISGEKEEKNRYEV